MDFIGNERFKGQDANYLLEEMENKSIFNKFNDAYKVEEDELEAIQKVLSDPHSNLTQEQKDFLAVKTRNYKERIELTPLPVAHNRKSIQDGDVKKVDNFNKAQRSAVVMRRFEYELRMKKNMGRVSKINKSKAEIYFKFSEKIGFFTEVSR